MIQLPDDFIKRIRNQFSPSEAEAFFHALSLPSPVSIRLHPQKNNPGIITDQAVPWCSAGYYLPKRPSFTLDPLFHAGTYYVQEAGSMLIEELLKPVMNELTNACILDACAAPGGKSTHLLSLFGKDVVLVSNEIIPNRNKTLRYNLAKWGYANKIITQSEPEKLATTQVRFDLIIVDAPCSGEGLFRKDPGAIQEWSGERATHCSRRQENILKALTPLLKQGGLLLYSTCTYNPDENDHQIELLVRSGQFEIITGSAPEGIVHTQYGWQAYPHRANTEGFYCCLLRYTGETASIGKSRHKMPGTTKDILGLKDKWLKKDSDLEIYSHNPNIHFANRNTAEKVSLLTGAYIREFGILAGEIKGKDLVPSFGLALSLDVSRNLPMVNLSRSAALTFLRCGPLEASAGQNGWHLICYEDAVVGWGKKINQRWNNYHPKEYRILTEIDHAEE